MSATEQPRRAWATPEQLAEWLQLGPNGVRKLRAMRRPNATDPGPRYVTVGREVRYAWVDVHAWCAARRANHLNRMESEL